jgi:hypothetical protein
MKIRLLFGLSLCLCAALRQDVVAQTPTPALTFQSAREGNAFPDNNGEIVLQLPEGAKATGGEVLLQNELGAQVGRIAVPNGATVVRIPLQNKGHFVLQARVTTATGVLTAQTSAAVLGPVPPDAERLSSALGMAKIGGNAELMAASGSGWDRGFTPQHAIAKNDQGEVDWIPGSRRYEPKEKYNRIEAVMSPPGWVVAPENRAKQAITVTYPPADWDAYRKVARVFASTRPWVKYFEGLNEPDANHWKGTDEELVKYHRVMREEVHAAGNGQKVLGPCFWSIDLTHLDKLVKLGLLDAVDGISMHSYANAPPEGKWIEDIRALKSYLAKQGRPDMPVFLTEYGWNTGAGDAPSPEQELLQARYAARGMSLLAAENLAGSQYFVLRYADNPRDNGWSITRGDNTPRPAYTAISHIFRWLGNAQGKSTLHPTPSSYLLLFSKNNRTVAVGWDTQGTSRIALPMKPLRAETMTGAPLSVTNQIVELSESPIFLEFDTPALASPASSAPPLALTRGKSLTLNDAPGQTALPLPLRVAGRVLSAPADATPGLYTGLQFANGQWRQFAVQVKAPWNIADVKVAWPVGSSAPEVQFTARNDAERVTLLPYLKLDSLPDEFGAPITLATGQSRTISIPIKNYFYGTRLQGRAMLEQHSANGVSSLGLPFDVLPIVAAQRGSTPVVAVPRLTSASWQAFGPGQPKSLPPADVSAVLQTSYDKQALHLRIAVRDDEEHFSSGTTPFWAADSVQFAFDLKPLAALMPASASLSTRRVLEYGAAKRDGNATVWRTMSTLPDLPQDVIEPQAKANIQRQGEETIYEIELPWRLLGLTQAPPAGSTLGFDLAINDSDGSIVDRAGLEITPGIVSTKDTAAFATLLFQ